MKKYSLPLLIWLLFAGIGVVLTCTLHNTFYLANFLYIGSFLALGLYLSGTKWPYSRQLVQFGVGSYMLVFLGLLMRENMQLSGFFYYLFLGVFEAAVIHYLVAKIAGPLIFGRGWCGYACWTAALLDLLPFKRPASRQRRRVLGWLRVAVFAVTLIFVAALFYLKVDNLAQIMFGAFVVGNIVYYAVGIGLAYYFKDNRAFCKYFCPVTVFLKPVSYFALLRVKVDAAKCIGCKKCLAVCPMNVDMLEPSRKRANGTECILCGECRKACPVGALKL